MKICAISDLHGYLPEDLEPCDILCICGDISPLKIQRYTHNMRTWLNFVFIPWVDKLPCEKVILIWGNHDYFGERHPEWAEMINQTQDKLVILQDSEVLINGKRFYGTPWCPNLVNWAFYKSDEELKEVFSKIPEKVDVLLTHCPPKIKDAGKVLQPDSFNFGRDFGCKELAEAVSEKKSTWVLSGHIHSGQHGPIIKDGINVVNVSMKDENYDVVYKPFIFEV